MIKSACSRLLKNLKPASSRRESARPRETYQRRLALLESLEPRRLLALQPVTLADSELLAPAATGNSLLRAESLSISADGQLIVFHSSANDLVPNDRNKASNNSSNLNDVYLFHKSTGETTLVSMNAAGTASGSGSSSHAKISKDGRYVLFESDATDLTAEPRLAGGGSADIFLRDLQTGVTTLVSRSLTDSGGNGDSRGAQISTDGRYVVFDSTASNLVPNDTNSRRDIFLRDLQTGTTTLISRNLAGTNGGNGESFGAQFSENGRFIAFMSRAMDLVSNDGTNIEDVFVHDLQTGVTELISIDSAGVNQSNAHNALSRGRAISADGRYVIFETQASNLVPQETAFQGNNVYLRDRQLGTTTVVTISADGTRGTGGGAATITPDGRYVAFVSGRSDLVPDLNDMNNAWDVFRRDLHTGTTQLVSWNASGTGSGNRASGSGQYDFDFVQGPPVMSDDGRFVAFTSEASNLVAGTTDANDSVSGSSTRRRDVFVRDMVANSTTLISVNRHGLATGDSGSYTPAMSADGNVVAFESHATDLVTGSDSLGYLDILVRDVAAQRTELASQRWPYWGSDRMLEAGGQLESATPDGRYVLLNSGGVLSVRDRIAGTATVESVRPDGTVTTVANLGAHLSADGRFLLFASSQSLATSGPNNTTGRIQAWLRDRQTGQTRMVTVNAAGGASNNNLAEMAFSPDGRYVAWTSLATDLVPGFVDNNSAGELDLFIRDLHTGITRLVSRAAGSDGQGGNGRSFAPKLSADGNRLIFLSRATDLVDGVTDTNSNDDVFVYDVATQAVDLVSVNQAGNGAGNRVSGAPNISADGRYVVFSSQASDLTAGMNPVAPYWDIFRRDLVSGATELVSRNMTGLLSGGNNSTEPSLSADGRYVAFTSDANDLVAGDSGQRDVFVRDMLLSVTTRASVSVDGGQSTGTSSTPLISTDGRQLAFLSTAANLVHHFTDANGGHADLYVRDLLLAVTELVTASHTGMTGADSIVPTTQGIQRYFTSDHTLIFTAQPDNLFPGDRNNLPDVFTWQLQGAGQIRGKVFDDANQSGVQEPGESGIAHWTVFVDANGNGRMDAGERHVQTDLDGNFAFTGLAAGQYSLRLRTPAGFVQTNPAGGQSLEVVVESLGTVVGQQDFGAAAAQVDLQVSGVFAPSSVSAGREFSVSWFVRNLGSDASAGDWQDAVYLSSDGILDANDTLVAVQPRTGGLAALGSYTATAILAAPAGLQGDFHVLVQTDRRRQVVGDLNRDNNVAASAQVQISLPTLVVGAPFADQFTSANQDRYYQVSVVAGDSLSVVLDSAALSGSTELYVRRLQLPTIWDYDFSSRMPSEPDQLLTVPVTLPGVYYVLARSRAGAASTSTFTVTASQPVLAIQSVSPNIGGNTGDVTVEIRGTRFTPTTEVSLVSGGTTINAASIDFRDSSLLYATFDLTDRTTGAYDVNLNVGALTATLSGGFAVLQGQSGRLDVHVATPEFVRAGREGTLAVEYVNASTNDIVSPLLRITADRALFRSEGRPNFESDEIYVLGISSSGPAGILRPGERGRIVVPFLSNGLVGQDINFEVFLGDMNQTMDWAGIKTVLRPGHIPADAWDAVFANFSAVVGTTVGEYQALLVQAATYLSQIGVYTSDVMRLLAFELDKADAAYTAHTLASVVDASFPTPGTDLTFSRSFLQAIHGRYAQGAFGRGWTHNWDVQATTLEDGNVDLRFGGSRRLFYKQADGSYRGGIGDHASLTLSNGRYTLIEINSTKWGFRNDGLLDFWEEDNGNRVSAGYTDGRLTTLSHTSGATITLDYSPQGRISQLTDPAGRIVTYVYDASGEHLTSYTDKYGTQTYTYVTGQGLPREHALASINYSDDTHVLYTYDARGRLIGEQRDDGSMVPIQYEYPSGGGLTKVDSAGGRTTLLFDDAGLLAKSIDPLGRVVQYAYDGQRNLLRADLPQGVQYAFEYDARGNVVRATDPLGHATEFTYDGRGNLLSFRDARGQATQYNYDAQDNLRAITYANGTVEQFEYDALGNSTQKTNRRGAAIDYTYNVRGQLTRKDFADGTHVDYDYDARGNLISATDADGTITLTHNNLDVLEKITYPDGKFLEFTYNVVAQRTKTVDQDGFTTNYQYDDLGRLATLTDGGGALIVQYTYDAAGRLVRKDNGNGTATTYEYDLAGQLVRLRNLAPDGTTVNSFFEYTYDALGLRTSQTSEEGTSFYGYDANGQLTSVSLPGGRIITYAYDAVGNRTSVTDGGVTTLYTTNLLNEYVLVGNTIYAYDADGNLVSKSDANGSTSYNFDDENRLIGVNGTGLTATYSYDPLGHRNSATVNGQRTDYLIDPLGLWSVAAEYDGGGNLLAQYTRGLGLAHRVAADGSVDYYDFDALGSTVGLTNAAGVYVNRYSYLPFGETTVLASAITNPFTFVGRFGVMEDGSGTIDMRMRNYDPTDGRFLSDDPIGLAGGSVNLRSYVFNSPSNGIDPIGEDAKPGSYKPPQGVKDLPPCGDKKFKGKKNPPLGLGVPTLNYDGGWLGDIIYEYKGEDKDYYYGEGLYSDDGQIHVFRQKKNASPQNAGGSGGAGGCGCDSPPGALPPAGGSQVGRGRSRGVGAFDPNDITGPAGFGNEHFVTPFPTLPYTIRFENDPEFATAPAQEVFITHQLDAHLDWNTVELDDFGFGSAVVDVPDGLQAYQARINYQNLDGSLLLVDVTAGLDLSTGILTWIFRSVDPLTGLLPAGVFDGFLPVNDETSAGEGFVSYFVRGKPLLDTGARIEQQASIVFDINEPILTNIYTNTIDAGPPTSSILPLPAATNSQLFTVDWSGQDDQAGSGVAFHDVYVAIDGGAYTLWLSGSTETSAEYAGEWERSYAFYVVATDNVGNRERKPAVAETTTTLFQVSPLPWQNPVNRLDVNADGTVSPVDVLILINWLNEFGSGPLPVPPAPPRLPPPYYDVTGNNYISPVNALLVINFLNSRGVGEGSDSRATWIEETPSDVPGGFMTGEGFPQPASRADMRWDVQPGSGAHSRSSIDEFDDGRQWPFETLEVSPPPLVATVHVGPQAVTTAAATATPAARRQVMLDDLDSLELLKTIDGIANDVARHWNVLPR